MKRIKKLASFVLAMIMVLAMAIPAMAAGQGSITIKENETVKVAGKTFAAYKILDVQILGADDEETEGVDERGYVYTVPDVDELKTFYAQRYNIAPDAGDFSAQVVKGISDEEDMFAFGKAVLEVVENVITPVTATGKDGEASVTINELDLGYYIVKDMTTGEDGQTVSALMIDTTNLNPTINIKADKPSIDKWIVEGENESKTNNVAVGDKVDFRVKSKVPDMTGYTKYYFVVNDVMSKGLTFNDDVVITIGADTLTDGEDYTVTYVVDEESKETAIEIVFHDFLQYRGDGVTGEDGALTTYPDNRANQEIIIEYSATLNQDAVIGVAGNPNAVNLTYSNNPNETPKGENDKPDPEDVVGKTPDSKTYTYVTGIELTKVDPEGNLLDGAKFEITGEKLNVVIVNERIFEEAADGTYYRLTDGTYTDKGPTDATKDKYESTDVKYKEITVVNKETNSTQFSTVGYVKNGVLKFEGLSEGTYYIEELIAPNGYNLLADKIKVEITCTTPTDEEIIKGNPTQCIWTFDATLDQKPLITDETANANMAAFRVENHAGSLLPSTGGIGTTIFYVVGGILVVAAGILLVTKKRMSAR